MRRFSKISGMTIVTCDFAHDQRYPTEPRTCPEEFRSTSVQSIVPRQLEIAGWRTRTIAPDGVVQVQDMCPDHSARYGLRRVGVSMEEKYPRKPVEQGSLFEAAAPRLHDD